MTAAAQQKIRDYLQGKAEPSSNDLRCFVGMIETGEATFEDFEAVDGIELTAKVAKLKTELDSIREENC